jgi:hypothetical protein
MSRLRFIEDGHRYILDGVTVPSNTQLLKAEGLIDTTFYTPDGRDRGSRVHVGCWFADDGTLNWKTVREEEKGYIKAFLQFKKDYEWVTDFNELPVWGSPGYGTRLDLLGVGMLQVDGVFMRRRAVIDIKTGKADKWVGWQTGGQKRAVVERIQAGDEDWTHHLVYVNDHPYPELRFALELKKDGKYFLKAFTDPTEETEYPALVHIYHWKARNGLLPKES